MPSWLLLLLYHTVIMYYMHFKVASLTSAMDRAHWNRANWLLHIMIVIVRSWFAIHNSHVNWYNFGYVCHMQMILNALLPEQRNRLIDLTRNLMPYLVTVTVGLVLQFKCHRSWCESYDVFRSISLLICNKIHRRWRGTQHSGDNDPRRKFTAFFYY